MSVILKKGTAIEKDPDADIPYEFDWSDWLAGAMITDSAWDITPTSSSNPLVNEADSIVGGTMTRVRVTGGEAGTDYRLTNQVTTDESIPRIDQRTLIVHCRER